MIDQSLAQPTPLPTTREQRALRLHREHGEGIEEISRGLYLCPSQDGGRYHHVDYRDETCDCPDHLHRGVACVHIYAVGISRAKRRARRLAPCSGCGEGFPASVLVEVGDEHVPHGHEVQEGQRYCRPCAARAGVL